MGGSKKRPNYPEHVRVLQMRLRVPLLCVNEVGELGRVTDEEDGGVIEDPIPVTFISSELDGEATGVASGVGRARFTTDGRETDCSADFLSHRSQQRLGCNVAEVMGDLEVTVSTSTFGMDLVEKHKHEIDKFYAHTMTYHTLRNTFSVEMSEEINVVEV